MLELFILEMFSKKERLIIEILKESQDYLEQFGINNDLLPDAISLIYRYLSKCEEIPHNLFKLLISTHYIVSRHPLTFPMHEQQQYFCEKFGIQVS